MEQLPEDFTAGQWQPQDSSIFPKSQAVMTAFYQEFVYLFIFPVGKLRYGVPSWTFFIAGTSPGPSAGPWVQRWPGAGSAPLSVSE